MSGSRYVTVIAGILDDRIFCHLCFIAESLASLLPNFYFKSIVKTSSEWKPWVQEICALHGWTHVKCPLVWREIGITKMNVSYVGGAYQFWELLEKYYNIASHLTKEDLDALHSDLLFVENEKQKHQSVEIETEFRHITIIGAGRSLCPKLVCELINMEEIWLSHGVVVHLYDEPGCFFQLKRTVRDIEAIGGCLNAAKVIDNVTDGLKNCDILIYLDALLREEYEGTENWLRRNYASMRELSNQINEYAPSHMKVIFCSTGPTCFCANVMHTLVSKVPKANIVAVSSQYGLELTYAFISSLGFTLKGFGCPPVWGYLGINQFVDVCHMVQKYDFYRPNERALVANQNSTLPLGVKRPELRWFFYMAHDKNPYKYHFQRMALALYQVGRTEDFQKCRAICDLLKLWYSKKEDIGDEIISLGVSSDGSFGIPRGLVFSQPVYLKVLEDNSRAWVPFADFPLPNMPIAVFQSLVDTAVIVTEKILMLSSRTSFVHYLKQQTETNK